MSGDHDGCEVCQALARGDEQAATAAMFEVPPPGSNRHVIAGNDHDAWLMAHGQEWAVPPEGPVTCPECGMTM